MENDSQKVFHIKKYLLKMLLEDNSSPQEYCDVIEALKLVLAAPEAHETNQWQVRFCILKDIEYMDLLLELCRIYRIRPDIINELTYIFSILVCIPPKELQKVIRKDFISMVISYIQSK